MATKAGATGPDGGAEPEAGAGTGKGLAFLLDLLPHVEETLSLLYENRKELLKMTTADAARLKHMWSCLDKLACLKAAVTLTDDHRPQYNRASPHSHQWVLDGWTDEDAVPSVANRTLVQGKVKNCDRELLQLVEGDWFAPVLMAWVGDPVALAGLEMTCKGMVPTSPIMRGCQVLRTQMKAPQPRCVPLQSISGHLFRSGFFSFSEVGWKQAVAREGRGRVAAGFDHSMMVTAAGGVVCCGNGEYGQLGNGGGDDSVPGPVTLLGALAGIKIQAVAAGAYHSMALTTTGRILTWGSGYNGRLGLGDDTSNRLVPTLVPDLEGVTDIAAGGGHSLAVAGDAGEVYTWGWGDNGQLGLGADTSHRDVPTRVPELGGIVAVGGGGYFSVALGAEGKVWTFGRNNYGQLGLGDSGLGTERGVPTVVEGLREVVDVAAGSFHRLAVTADGAMYSWGRGAVGELGTGSTDMLTVPTRIEDAGLATWSTASSSAAPPGRSSQSFCSRAFGPTASALTSTYCVPYPRDRWQSYLPRGGYWRAVAHWIIP